MGLKAMRYPHRRFGTTAKLNLAGMQRAAGSGIALSRTAESFSGQQKCLQRLSGRIKLQVRQSENDGGWRGSIQA